MDKLIKKPLFGKYKAIMIPHILPRKAKELRINKNNEKEWKALVRSVRKIVKERYQKADAKELWNDMSFKRYTEKAKETHLRKQESASCSSQAKASIQKQQRVISDSLPIIVTDDYAEDGIILGSLKHCSRNTKDWIECRRAELLGKISDAEMAMARSISSIGFKIILKMPFYIDGRIYFTHLFIPKLRLAIDIAYQTPCISTKDIGKTSDLYSAGIRRIKVSAVDAINPETAAILVENILRKR